MQATCTLHLALISTSCMPLCACRLMQQAVTRFQGELGKIHAGVVLERSGVGEGAVRAHGTCAFCHIVSPGGGDGGVLLGKDAHSYVIVGAG